MTFPPSAFRRFVFGAPARAYAPASAATGTSPASGSAAQGRQAYLSGRAVLIWLGGFFAVVIAVNATFITMSVKTFSGEDEQKPYLQGMEYNGTLARRSEQHQLGWRGEIGATRLADGAVRIAVAVKDAAGRPLPGLTLVAELRHPADERRDHELSLRETAPGLYQSDVPGVAPGHWDVLVSGKSRAPFEADRRLWVP